MGLVLVAGCTQHDIKTVTVRVPQMTNAACAEQVRMALRGATGIGEVVPDSVRGEVHVSYDSLKLAPKNVQFLIAGAGFDADDVPARLVPHPNAVTK